MCAGVSAFVCWTLLCVQLLLVSADQKTVKARSGNNISLSCQVSITNPVMVEWSRVDLPEEKYVLYYGNKTLDPDNQHTSFRNRVHLQESQVTNGNLALILKNVTRSDAGTYECRIIQRRRSCARMLRTTVECQPACVINLTINSAAGPPGGRTEGGAVGLTVALLLLLVF